MKYDCFQKVWKGITRDWSYYLWKFGKYRTTLACPRVSGVWDPKPELNSSLNIEFWREKWKFTLKITNRNIEFVLLLLYPPFIIPYLLEFSAFNLQIHDHRQRYKDDDGLTFLGKANKYMQCQSMHCCWTIMLLLTSTVISSHHQLW